MQINHIGISGGKDSTALLLWAIHESGYPVDSLRVTFCDTGNEHELTYEHVNYLSDYLERETGRGVIWLYPDRDFYELAENQRRFPSACARFCTEHLKLIPLKRYVEWLDEGGADVLIHSGVRAGESEDRAKQGERGIDSYTGFRVFRPLFHWDIQDVWDIHSRYGVRRNPLYDLGLTRVGCLPCIMSRKKEIAIIARTMPERIRFLSEQETRVAQRSKNGNATFFYGGTPPFRYRSKTYVKNRKDGGQTIKLNGLFLGDTVEQLPVEPRSVAYATLDDVVRWATKEVEVSGTLDFDNYDPELESIGSCAWESGACE